MLVGEIYFNNDLILKSYEPDETNLVHYSTEVISNLRDDILKLI